MTALRVCFVLTLFVGGIASPRHLAPKHGSLRLKSRQFEELAQVFVKGIGGGRTIAIDVTGDEMVGELMDKVREKTGITAQFRLQLHAHAVHPEETIQQALTRVGMPNTGPITFHARFDLNGGVVNGGPVASGVYPWFVFLNIDTDTKRSLCGASLVHPNIVMTAAHCLKKPALPVTVKAWVNIVNRDAENQQLDVSHYQIHSGYSSRTIQNDIALIFLRTPVENIAPVSLPWSGAVASLFSDVAMMEEREVPVHMMGFGRTSEDGPAPRVLMGAMSNIRKHDQCTLSKFRFPMMLCAGDPENEVHGGKDTCQGDSGGPIAVNTPENGPLVQVGVVSFGNGCARGEYGAYSNVQFFKSWIVERVKSAEDYSAAPMAAINQLELDQSHEQSKLRILENELEGQKQAIRDEIDELRKELEPPSCSFFPCMAKEVDVEDVNKQITQKQRLLKEKKSETESIKDVKKMIKWYTTEIRKLRTKQAAAQRRFNQLGWVENGSVQALD